MLDILNKYFQKDEKIIMTFTPDLGRNFNYKDIVLLPLGVCLFLVALGMLIYSFIKNIETSYSAGSWVIWLLILSLYLIWGRFFVKKSRKKNTYYCITNKNFYRITKNIFGEKFVSVVNIRDVDAMDIDGEPPESCTIVFKKSPVCFTKFFANTGLALESPFYAFLDVKKVNKICETITELKQQAEIAELIETREKIEEIKRANLDSARREIETVDEFEKNNNNPEI